MTQRYFLPRDSQTLTNTVSVLCPAGVLALLDICSKNYNKGLTGSLVGWGEAGGRKEEGKGEGERDWSGNLLAVFKNSLVYALIRIISEICNITLSA